MPWISDEEYRKLKNPFTVCPKCKSTNTYRYRSGCERRCEYEIWQCKDCKEYFDVHQDNTD
jgi:hypothetical protein